MTKLQLSDLRLSLQALADPRDAEFLQRYFKTAPGQYGAGDRFLGIRVPKLRLLARAHRELASEELLELLRSSCHEERLLALLILVEKYRRGDGVERETVHRLYLDHTPYINNWDLVDCSAEYIVGAQLDPDRIELLLELALSPSVWERRIAVMSTFHFVKRCIFAPTLRLADTLRDDRHDLIHKAVGWMLREVGKRDLATEISFLDRHCRIMPRTMLRYAIERFPEPERQRYLKGLV